MSYYYEKKVASLISKMEVDDDDQNNDEILVQPEIRIQPARQAKIRFGEVPIESQIWVPDMKDLSVDKKNNRWWQMERIKRFGVFF